MLGRFFRYIRRQPKAVRSRYAFGFASTFTGIVALIWVMNSSALDFNAKQIAKEEDNSNPFSTITKQVKEQMANLRGSVEDLKEEAEKEEGEGLETDEAKELEVADETPQNPTEIVLSEEDLELIGQKNQTATTTTGSSSKPVYREVMIATTSKAVATSSTESE